MKFIILNYINGYNLFNLISKNVHPEKIYLLYLFSNVFMSKTDPRFNGIFNQIFCAVQQSIRYIYYHGGVVS